MEVVPVNFRCWHRDDDRRLDQARERVGDSSEISNIEFLTRRQLDAPPNIYRALQRCLRPQLSDFFEVSIYNALFQRPS